MRRFVVPSALLIFFTACAGLEPPSDKREVLSHALATTAQLFVEREGGVRRAGSAVILSANGPNRETAILTTAHLLEPPAKQTVTVIDETREYHTPAEVVAIDPALDLALVMAPIDRPSTVKLAAEAELADDVLVVAFPWGRERTVVNGAVSQISAPNRASAPVPISGPVRLVDASVSYGMSGGGVYHRKTGELVGIVRGYRTAHLSLSSEPAPLKLPIAGETTVIPAVDIVCFLRAENYENLVPAQLAKSVSAQSCNANE